MEFLTLKTVSIKNEIARESINTIEINPAAIVMIRKEYYTVIKEEDENQKVINDVFYRISFVNGESVCITKQERDKLSK